MTISTCHTCGLSLCLVMRSFNLASIESRTYTERNLAFNFMDVLPKYETLDNIRVDFVSTVPYITASSCSLLIVFDLVFKFYCVPSV
jgi:hypothetical protein